MSERHIGEKQYEGRVDAKLNPADTPGFQDRRVPSSRY